MSTVKPGTSDGNEAAVDGIQPNALVAVSGFDRLQDGALVATRDGGSGGSSSGNAQRGANGQNGRSGQNGQNGQNGSDKQRGEGGKANYKNRSNGEGTP